MESQTPQSREVAPPVEKPRRWWHHWPVLIPIVLIGGLLWMGLWYSRRAQLLEDAGGVEFEAPTWALLEMFAGPEVRAMIGSPSSLHLGGERPTASQLRMVAGFDELTDFAAAGMTDADLEYLAGCTKLETLGLEQSSITDAGVQSLSQFAKLKDLLIITDQPLTGVSIDAMKPLKRMRKLSFDAPEIADVDFAPLGSLSKLEWLTLSGVEIRGDDLKHLTGLPGLRGLQLQNCRIDPDALAALQPILSGPNLYLNGSNITDEHIPAIEQLTWLLFVSLVDTQVSDEACRRLKQARPGMNIRNARGERVKLPANDSGKAASSSSNGE